MHPIIFQFGPITLYSYGLLVATGFIIGTLLASREAGALNIPPEKIINLFLAILISGIIGARLLYVILNIKDYASNPVEIIMVTRGGLVFYGGAMSALIISVFYIKRAGLKFFDVADLIAPYIALGHSIGRIGCLLNGCCYGKPAAGAAGVIFRDGIVRTPTQIYSSLYLLFLYIVLRVCFKYRRFQGQVFFFYLILYSIGRVFIEHLRGDNPVFAFGLTFSQILSVAVFGIGFLGYLLSWIKTK